MGKIKFVTHSDSGSLRTGGSISVYVGSLFFVYAASTLGIMFVLHSRHGHSASVSLWVDYSLGRGHSYSTGDLPFSWVGPFPICTVS